MNVAEVTYRQIAAGEFSSVLPIYEEMGEPLPLPENTVMYVAEVGGMVVGYIGGQVVVSVSPLWVRRDFRGSEIAVRLAAEGYARLPVGMQKILITSNPHVELLARAMGFAPRLGQLWLEMSERKAVV